MSNNVHGLHRLLDMIRMIAVFLLLLHFYFYCYAGFRQWGLVSVFSDRIMLSIAQIGLFNHFNTTKFWTLGLLMLSLMGRDGRKIEQLRLYQPLVCVGTGLLFYFGSAWILNLSYIPSILAVLYMAPTFIGFILILTGLSFLSRILWLRLGKDVFNSLNESFPQEERCLKNDSYINLPLIYLLNGRQRRGWINIPSFRGLLILGQPGSGKSWYVVQNVIRQHIALGFAMVVLDYKYDELTRTAYNYYLKHKSSYPVQPEFVVLHFENVNHSHRCNPLHMSTLKERSDASEASRSALLGLNRSWIEKEGDYWVESAISFMTALIWYLRKYQNGKYCTFPHVIELAQIEYGKLFSILRAEPDIQNYISSFLSAYLNDVTETLDNQISSFRIAISRLSSPEIYYVMTGDDFSLDINNPASPKILCIGNSPQRSGIYGSIISLYLSTINRLVNKKGGLKSSHVYEELPAYYVHRLNEILATGRSNEVAITMCAQNIEQIRFVYGKAQADVIVNLSASVICGQASGDAARYISDRIGKNVQERESVQINRVDTSFSKSTALDMAVPPAKISQLSSGEFVGVVGDTPDDPVKFKAFHGHIDQDNKQMARAQAGFKSLPTVRDITDAQVKENYNRIVKEVGTLVETELKRMRRTSGLSDLIIDKN